MSLNKLAELLQ